VHTFAKIFIHTGTRKKNAPALLVEGSRGMGRTRCGYSDVMTFSSLVVVTANGGGGLQGVRLGFKFRILGL
jgi:hypothetical protein